MNRSTKGILLLSLISILPLTAMSQNEKSALAEKRKDMLTRASVWQTPSLSMTDVPAVLPLKDKIICDFVYEVFQGGYSPKFKCLNEKGKKVKVKYFNGKNRELFSEVVSGRLMVAIGFGADRNEMVEVECRNCPANDPWSWVDPRGGLIQEGLKHGKTIEQIKSEHSNEIVPVRIFPFAAVEKKMKGQEIGDWGWDEMHRINKKITPVKQRDALKLMAAVIQHADNSSRQNSLICPTENLVKNENGLVTDCTNPLLYIQDLGGTLGGGGPIIHRGGAADFNNWKSTPVWKDGDTCHFYLRAAGPPSFSHLHSDTVKKEARDFLVERLEAIDAVPEAFENIFRAAGMDAGGFHPENHSAHEWAEVLRSKIKDLKNATSGS